MATFFIAFTLQVVLIATTFSSCAWAMNNLMKPNNQVSSNTTNRAPVKIDTRGLVTQNPTGVQQAAEIMQPPPNMGCRPQDISIKQRQVSNVGTPQFQVVITNTCMDPKCYIHKIVAYCGQFSSAYPINPNVFRRLSNGPNCAVNNLLPMSPGQSLAFRYDTEFMAPIRLASAEPVCRQ